MRLGGPVFDQYKDPEEWLASIRKEGHTAAYCPVGADADYSLVKAYAEAAEANDIRIAECGAWSNPISDDPEERRQALKKCKDALLLAERIGAGCCVNIAGSRSAQWDGPDLRNYSKETFDMIVESVREIIDAVKPERTFYTLETMPWIYPFSADSYLELIKAVDRQAFAVHFDPVNLVSGVANYYENGAMIKDFIAKLGPWIKSCHCKDISLAPRLTVHLDEVMPGQGNLEYPLLIRALSSLGKDITLMLEHLKSPEEYRNAAAFIRKTAEKESIKL